MLSLLTKHHDNSMQHDYEHGEVLLDGLYVYVSIAHVESCRIYGKELYWSYVAILP